MEWHCRGLPEQRSEPKQVCSHCLEKNSLVHSAIGGGGRWEVKGGGAAHGFISTPREDIHVTGQLKTCPRAQWRGHSR